MERYISIKRYIDPEIFEGVAEELKALYQAVCKANKNSKSLLPVWNLQIRPENIINLYHIKNGKGTIGIKFSRLFNGCKKQLCFRINADSGLERKALEKGIYLFNKVFTIDKFKERVIDNLNALNDFFDDNIEMSKNEKERKIEYILACSLEKNETNFILDIEIVKGKDKNSQKSEGDIGFLYKSKNLENKFLPTELKIADQLLNNSENIISARDQALKLAWDLHGAYSNYEITYE